MYLKHAQCKALLQVAESLSLTLAPLSSKYSTISRCPSIHATCKGKCLVVLLPVEFVLAPWSEKKWFHVKLENRPAWKFHDSRRSAVLAILGAMKMINLVNFSLQKNAKINHNHNSEPVNVLKWQILHFYNPKNWFHVKSEW